MPQGLAGHHSRVNAHYEDVFDAQTDADVRSAFALGWNTQLTTAEGRREIQRVFQPSTREALDLLDLHFEGSVTLEYTLANPWVLEGITGAPTTTANDTDGDGTTDNYTHTYEVSRPSSMRLYEAYPPASAERIVTGFVPARLSVDVSVQEEARVTVEGGYAREFVNKSVGSLDAQQNPAYDAMTFVEGQIQIGGSVEGYVQQMTLEAQANVDMINEMGTSFFIDYIAKTFEPSVNFTRIKASDEATKNIEDLYAGSTSVQEDAENYAAVNVLFDNGGTGANENSIDFEAGGTLTETYDENSVGDPEADLEEVINRVAQTLKVTATNDTATAP